MALELARGLGRINNRKLETRKSEEKPCRWTYENACKMCRSSCSHVIAHQRTSSIEETLHNSINKVNQVDNTQCLLLSHPNACGMGPWMEKTWWRDGVYPWTPSHQNWSSYCWMCNLSAAYTNAGPLRWCNPSKRSSSPLVVGWLHPSFLELITTPCVCLPSLLTILPPAPLSQDLESVWFINIGFHITSLWAKGPILWLRRCTNVQVITGSIIYIIYMTEKQPN